ncbi:MAG: radical SAM protein [Candidatus Hermodarchaeota archaeon]
MSDDNTLKKSRLRVANALLNSDIDGKVYKVALLLMSNQCNSNCVHCYQWGTPAATWSLSEAKNVVQILRREGYFLIPEINEMLPETLHLLEIYKDCGATEISTNGETLLEYPHYFNVLRENRINEIRITVLAPSLHENWTKRKRTRATEALELAKKNDFRTILNFVVSRSSMYYLEEICQEAVTLGVDEINFLNLIFGGRALKIPQELLRQDDIIHFYDFYDKARKKYPLIFDRVGNFGPNPREDSVSHKLAKNGRYCLMGNWQYGSLIFVDPYFDVFPCMLVRGKQHQIGKLTTDKLEFFDYPVDLAEHDHCQCFHLKNAQKNLEK